MSVGEWWRRFEEASVRHKQELQPIPVFVSHCWHLMGDQTAVCSLLAILMCAHLCTHLLADKLEDHVTATLSSIFTDASIITKPPLPHLPVGTWRCGFIYFILYRSYVVEIKKNISNKNNPLPYLKFCVIPILVLWPSIRRYNPRKRKCICFKVLYLSHTHVM